MNNNFSINALALGNLRRRRGRYLLLITGIVLAIYFVATALLFGTTMFTSLKERHYHHNGKQEAIIFNCREAPLSELFSKGIFSEYGTAETLGYVLPDGQSMQNGFSIARFDESALKLAGKDLLSGRLPEKSGEIALEQSTLARLRSGAGVGDQVTLTLLIPDGADFLEKPLRKNYTLVGILSDKLIYLHNRLGLERPAYRDPPAGVLAESEPIEAGGRPVVSCYGTFGGKAKDSYEQLEMFCKENELLNDWGWADLAPTRYRFPGDNFGNDNSDIMATSILLIVITLVLVGAACLGIINAFAADLESRRRQIGLFRAVGSTRKQIKQIFGREAFLLSAFSIPPALTLACLTVWGISKILGNDYTFRPSALIVVGLAAAGLLCVKLAASLPLGRASRIPPLQAIRNTDLFRKARRSRLQSRAAFDVPRLIALRHRLLYPNRQTGITVMLALSIVLVSLAVFALTPALKEANYDYGCDFVLRAEGRMHNWLMEYSLHLPGITEQDKADAAALAGVKEVAGEKNLQVKILPDKITPYIIDSGYDRFDYLSPEQQGEYLNIHDDQYRNEWLSIQYSNYQELKAKYGYDRDFLSVDCCGADEILVKKLTPFVVSGQINLDKLNAGEEILIVAPEEYGFIYKEHDDGSANWSWRYKLDPHTAYSSIRRNDMFAAGDRLALSLLYDNSPGGHPDGPQEYHDDGSRKLPDDAVRIDKTVTIGAILTPEAGDKHLAGSFSSYFYPQVGDIVTTVAGLQALGFDLPYSALAVNLGESPDQALEEYLEANLALIAARTAGTNLTSHLALTRENRRTIFGLLVAAAATLILFFAICASMINNALSARIRAGRREIGTLRAVGASGREIELSYRRQLLAMFAWGTIGGLVAELAFCGWILKTQEGFADFVPTWQPLIFVALLFGLCYLNMRAKVGNICRGSIVENIREL